jgi:hypothetical protein
MMDAGMTSTPTSDGLAAISAPRTKVRAISPRIFSTRRLCPARMERILHAMGLTGRQHRRWTGGMTLRECAATWDVSEAEWVQELRENIEAFRAEASL